MKGVQSLLEAWDSIVDRIDGKLLLVGPIDQNMKAVQQMKKWQNVE